METKKYVIFVLRNITFMGNLCSRRQQQDVLSLHVNCPILFFLMVCLPCIVMYPYNTNQKDALFSINLFQ